MFGFKFKWFQKPTVKNSRTDVETVGDYTNGSKTEYNTNGSTYYSSSDLVNTCVNYISEIGSMTQLKIYKRDNNGNLVKINNKKVNKLFAVAPNQFITWNELLSNLITSYLLTGNAFIGYEKLTNYELWHLPTDDMQVVPDANVYIKGYLFNKKVAYDVNEVIHIRRGNTYNKYYGTSVLLDVIKDYLDLEALGISDLKSFYENGTVGSSILETELPLNADQIKDLRKQYQDSYSKTKRHSTVVLPQNIKHKSVKMSPKDSLLLEAMQVTEDRVYKAFRLNSSVLGGHSDVPRAYEALIKITHALAVQPIVESIAAQIQLHFRTVLKDDNIVVVADYSRVPYVNEIPKDKAEGITKLWSAGLMSNNEARDIINLPRVDNDNYDKRFIPSFLFGEVPVDLDSYDGTALTPASTQPPASSSPTGGASDGVTQ